MEWDAFLRICFNRKNKTLSALFKNKKLLSHLVNNDLHVHPINSTIMDCMQEEKEEEDREDREDEK
jgi:hypothetical protein